MHARTWTTRSITLMVGVALVVAACRERSMTAGTPPSELARGTWGGDNAGALVQDSVHVHIGCTLGNFLPPASLSAEGRFSVVGSYTLRAFPIAVGPPLPADFAGVVKGNQLTLTVAVHDTVEKKVVNLGPVTLVLGREPRMQACPICRRPAEMP